MFPFSLCLLYKKGSAQWLGRLGKGYTVEVTTATATTIWVGGGGGCMICREGKGRGRTAEVFTQGMDYSSIESGKLGIQF